MAKCHICGNPTDWYCRDCDEPVCEDCCVPVTLQNQIDFTLCTICHEGNEARRSMVYWKEEERQERVDRERNLRNKKRRDWYRKPENIRKRRIAREERTRLREKSRVDALSKAFKLVGGWLK